MNTPSPQFVTCVCQNCPGHVEFDTTRVGEVVACPHCGLETRLYIPKVPLHSAPEPETRPPESTSPPPVRSALQYVRVEIKRGVSPLGVVALALGIMSCLFCWTPLLHLLAIPLALIGLLLAFAGMVLASTNRKTGFVFPISGGIVCILSVIIAFVATGGFSKAASLPAERAKKTNQESERQSPGRGISNVEEVAISSTAKQRPNAAPPSQTVEQLSKSQPPPNAPPSRKTKEVTTLPFVGDETTIAQLLAAPRDYANKPVTICGALRVGNYYNYSYDSSASTHYSLQLWELSKNNELRGYPLSAYAPRTFAKPLVDEILKVEAAYGARKIARVKVLLTSRSFGDSSFNECVELVDWQFLTPDTEWWQPWARSRQTPTRPAKPQ